MTPTAETWAWWEARRLRYNIALAISGWAAYGVTAILFAAFGRSLWYDGRTAFGMTIFLGTAFLVLMGTANICFLLGPVSEAIINPQDRDAFRRRAWALGFWGSMALPFLYPLGNLAMLVMAGPVSW